MTRRGTRLVCGALAAIPAIAGASLAQSPVPFTKSDLYFELNATDGDAGLHGILDGDAWKTTRIKGPGGTFDVIRAIANQDSPEFGMTELFFESNEPPLDERSFAELLTLFPPGTYTFTGTTTANQPMRGSDVLTRAMPCPPVVQRPRVVDGDLSIRWRLRPGSYNPDTGVCSAANAVTPVVVQVFVEFTNTITDRSRQFAVDMPPRARTVEVPDEFLLGVNPDNTEAKAEVLVVDRSGNRTAIEVEFEL